MLTFEVKTEEVNEKRGTSPRTGKAYVIREQAAYIDIGKAYPVEVKLGLNDLAPFKPGVYEIGAQCLYVQRFGEVGLDLSKARAVAGAAPARPARLAG